MAETYRDIKKSDQQLDILSKLQNRLPFRLCVGEAGWQKVQKSI